MPPACRCLEITRWACLSLQPLLWQSCALAQCKLYVYLVSARGLSAFMRRVLHSTPCFVALLALSWPRGRIRYQPFLLSTVAVAVYGLLPMLASQQMCVYSSICEYLSVAVAEQSKHLPGNCEDYDSRSAANWGVCCDGQITSSHRWLEEWTLHVQCFGTPAGFLSLKGCMCM